MKLFSRRRFAPASDIGAEDTCKTMTKETIKDYVTLLLQMYQKDFYAKFIVFPYGEYRFHLELWQDAADSSECKFFCFKTETTSSELRFEFDHNCMNKQTLEWRYRFKSIGKSWYTKIARCSLEKYWAFPDKVIQMISDDIMEFIHTVIAFDQVSVLQ